MKKYQAPKIKCRNIVLYNMISVSLHQSEEDADVNREILTKDFYSLDEE